MQNTGTLSELPLTELLGAVQKDRATGTLHVKSGGEDATLYFLFGHLFHAVQGDRQGEPVVDDALNWTQGDFTFDAKAKLPAEESIKTSTAEILERHSGAGGDNGVAEALEPAAEQEVESTPEVEDVAEADPEPEPEVDVEEVVSEPVSEPALSVEDEAEDDSPRRRRTDVRPDTRPPETMELYPVPRGKLIYEALTASFVDFPKVLRSLAKDGHTGYVSLTGQSFSGVLLFSSGAVVEAIYDGGGRVGTGSSAFDSFAENIDAGEGVLDVIQLTPEMVTALYQLLTAPSVYEKLLGRFVRADALLEHLSEIGASGAVIVRSGGENGIVLYREGVMLGAYTGDHREVTPTADVVLALCEEPHAEIEVRGGPVPQTLPVMDPTGKGPTEVPSGSVSSAPVAPVTPAPSAPEPEPEPGPDPAPAAESADGVAHAEADWSELIEEMAGRADAVLGTRSKRVKEMLYATPQSREEVEATLDRIAELSIMFVDPSKLTALADEMRQIAAGGA